MEQANILVNLSLNPAKECCERKTFSFNQSDGAAGGESQRVGHLHQVRRCLSTTLQLHHLLRRMCDLKEDLKNSARLWMKNYSWQIEHLTNFSNRLRWMERKARCC